MACHVPRTRDSDAPHRRLGLRSCRGYSTSVLRKFEKPHFEYRKHE